METKDLRTNLLNVQPGDRLRLCLKPGSNMHLPAVHAVRGLREKGILSISEKEMLRIDCLAQNWALGAIDAVVGAQFHNDWEIFLEAVHCFGLIEKA